MEREKFNARKFDSLVHFIISKCGDPKKLGATRLNKILWFSDKYSYWETGKTITGALYMKQQHGPVPHQILPSLDRLKDAGKIKVQDPDGKYQVREFTSLREPDVNEFTREELGIASAVINEVCGYTATEISEMTHDDVWKIAQIGEEIPFQATLCDVTTDIPEEVKSWANNSIANR